MKRLLTRLGAYLAILPITLATVGHIAATTDHQPVTGCLATTAEEVAVQVGIEDVEFVGTHDNPDAIAYVATNRPDQVVLDLTDVEPWCGVPGWDDTLRETIAHELAHVTQYRTAGLSDARWGRALWSVPATLLALPRLQDQLAENMPTHLEGMDALEASADCATEHLGMRVTPGYGNACSPAMLTDAAQILETGRTA